VVKEDTRLAALGFRVGTLHRLYLLCMRDSMINMDISVSLIPFLGELYHYDGISQDMLSERVNMDKGSTARAIARLERKGLVRRDENKSNRREKLVRLTAKAIGMREKFFSPLYKMSRIMSKGFSIQKRNQLLESFDSMTENLQYELTRQRRRGRNVPKKHQGVRRRQPLKKGTSG
jgi:DNA-binding MarR family transcriptional regulator